MKILFVNPEMSSKLFYILIINPILTTTYSTITSEEMKQRSPISLP